MLNNLINGIVYFLTPFLVIIAPLHMALITLSIFIFINYLSATICVKKNKGINLWRAIFNNINLKRFFKKYYEYALGILVIGLFEVHILAIDIATGGIISLLRVTIVTAGVIELNQIFINIECVTGSNLLTSIIDKIPEPIKKYFIK